MLVYPSKSSHWNTLFLAKADAKGADPQFGFRAFQRPEGEIPSPRAAACTSLAGRRTSAQEAPREPLGVLSGRAFPVRTPPRPLEPRGPVPSSDSFAPQNARSEYRNIRMSSICLEVVDISPSSGPMFDFARIRTRRSFLSRPRAGVFVANHDDAGDCRETAMEPINRSYGSRPTVPLAR